MVLSEILRAIGHIATVMKFGTFTSPSRSIIITLGFCEFSSNAFIRFKFLVKIAAKVMIFHKLQLCK